MTILGDRLKEMRKKKRMTLSEVAEKLKLRGHSTYSNWEYGRTEPDTAMLHKLADLYNTTTDYLTGKTDDPSISYEPLTKNEFIIREIVNKYDIDLTAPGNREKMEKLVELLYDRTAQKETNNSK